MVYCSVKDEKTSKILEKLLKHNSLEHNKKLVDKLLSKTKIQLASYIFIGKIFEELEFFSEAVKYYTIAAQEYTKEAIIAKDPYTLKSALDSIKNLLRFNTSFENASGLINILQEAVRNNVGTEVKLDTNSEEKTGFFARAVSMQGKLPSLQQKTLSSTRKEILKDVTNIDICETSTKFPKILSKSDGNKITRHLTLLKSKMAYKSRTLESSTNRCY